jgi:hypothetical protein
VYFDEDCILKVKHVKGKVYGTKYVMKSISGDCLTKEVKEMGTTEGLLKHDDVLVMGTEIKTDADSYVYVDLPDGSTIILAPYSFIKINDDWCGNRGFFLGGGSVWIKVKRMLGMGEFKVSDERMTQGVRGTEFTIEHGEFETTIRVIEGTVEVEQLGTGGTKNISDMGKEMEQLTKDFQEGKISQDEYLKKMKEFQNPSKSSSKDNAKVTVTGGYMLVVSPNAIIDKPEPLAGGSNWYEGIQWDPEE